MYWQAFPPWTKCMHRSKAGWAITYAFVTAGQAADQNAAPTLAYAGSESVAMGHEDLAKAFVNNPHYVVETDKRRGWEGKACEACHGPGQKHIESVSPADIRNPSKLTAAATDKVCLTCHLGQPALAGRLQSSHAKNQWHAPRVTRFMRRARRTWSRGLPRRLTSSAAPAISA